MCASNTNPDEVTRTPCFTDCRHLLAQRSDGIARDRHVDLAACDIPAALCDVHPGSDRSKIAHFDVMQHRTATGCCAKGPSSRGIALLVFRCANVMPRTVRSSAGGLSAMGVAEVVNAPRSSWQNPYLGRVIGSIIFGASPRVGSTCAHRFSMPKDRAQEATRVPRPRASAAFLGVPRCPDQVADMVCLR
jgi:hypothetical protein